MSRGTDDAIQPFTIAIPQADLDDLRDRLGRTRWPGELPGVGWSRGVPVSYLRELAAHWRDGYDWRAQEAQLNTLPQFKTEIDGQTIHFAHVRSAREDATPLLLLYDWPGSFVVFTKVVAPLSRDFHLIIPNLPGVAFSSPLTTTGWNIGKIAGAYAELMARLGYERYGVLGQGGASGQAIAVGRLAPDRVVGIHGNGLLTFPSGDPNDFVGLTGAEQERLARLQHFRDEMLGFNFLQATRPYTIAHALTDSPVGQLAWIVEKFKEWTDPAVELPEDAVGRDTLLTNVSLYWFTRTAGSSANLYYEAGHDPSAWASKERSAVPTGVTVALNNDIAIRRFAERDSTITRWSEVERGGNFLPLEQPALYVEEVRAFFDTLR
jgi:pimeloyl-ACP methyl ester carboxylesterase